MSFFEAVRTCLFQNYADFQGRASRAEYWWFALFSLVLSVPLLLSGFRPSGLLVVAGVAVLVTAIPHLAVTVRRLHDTDRSGRWVLLGAGGPVLGSVMDVGDLVGWIAHLVLLWFLAQKGDSSGNRYGPNPASEAVLGLGRPGVMPPRHGD